MDISARPSGKGLGRSQMSDATIRTLFETMHEGFALHEVICNDTGEVIDYRYLDLNPAFELLTGLQRETTVGRTVREVLPGIEEEWIQCFGRVALTGIPADRESYVQELDRYYRARAYSPEKGKFAVVFEETTAQRRAQKELERREEQLRVLFESSQAGIFLIDLAGRITMANQRMADLFACSLPDLIGSSYPSLVHPDQNSTADDRMRQILRGEVASVSMERHFLRRDGGDFWGYVSVRRHEEQDGTLISLVAHLSDITALKQASEALHESEQKYRELVEKANSIILKLDRQGKIIFVNEFGQQFFGYSEAELVGRSVMETIVPEREITGRDLAKMVKEVFTNPEKYTRNINENICKDGRRVWVSWSNNPIVDARGNLVGMFSVGSDITAQRLVEEQLARAHQRLAESETLYRTLFEQSPDGIVLTDPADTRSIYFNTAMHQQLGYSREEFASLRVADYEELETPEQIAARIAALPETSSSTFESTHRTKQGEVRNVLVTLRRVTIGDQSRILAIVRDVSEQKRVQHALLESEQLYRNLVETTATVAWEVDVASLRFSYISPQIEKLSGYPPEQWTDFHFWVHCIHPDDRDEAVGFCQAETARGLDHAFDYRLITADGRAVWVRDVVSVIHEGGRPVALRGYFFDISERKRADEELRLSERKYASIFQLMPDMVGITRLADGCFVEVNQGFERWTGWKKEEVIGRSSLDLGLWSPEARARAVEIIKRQGYLEDFEFILGTKSGEQRNALMYLIPITVMGEQCLYFMARDITERRRAEEERLKLEQQLLHAQKLESLGVLAGGIAHDFNNILTAIIGNAELALMRLNPESPAQENLQRIEKAAARAADLAKQMLAYSGKGKFVVEHIDINRLVKEMGHMLEVSISKKALLRYNLTPSLPAINVDATQIRQVVMNLVINASEAISDKSGVIVITTGCMECTESYLQDAWLADPIPEGLYVTLEVADTGCGMDRETLGKIFDPFFTTKFTGRGLGMAAVLGIVRGHKGAIKVYSEPGKGSSFKVLLPAGEKPAELFNGTTVPDDWRGSGTVLLVDDEETVRAIGAEMLRELGYEVITATDGRDALAKYRSRTDICLVVMDLTMPHMDGEQAFRELRQLDPNIKVIMSSGFSESEVIQKFAGKGLADFVQKPYKLSTLKEVIRKL